MTELDREHLGLVWGSAMFWGRVASETADQLAQMGHDLERLFRVPPVLGPVVSPAEQSFLLRLRVGTYCTAVHNVSRLASRFLGEDDPRVVEVADLATNAKDVRDVFMHPEDYAFGKGRRPVEPGFEGVRNLIRLRNGVRLEVGLPDRMVPVSDLAEPLEVVVAAITAEANERTSGITLVSPESSS